ncbi:hypothetical protein ILUMI_25683 [Ignelater luminosus]|uniref:Uncharacterized protein n=1 Tax=Ignelater luminosus TaxID=2038154 RepID=A0A8K0C7X9_IGNLU|nr:hypothetical protein ILUMI_25683 [Ignelater luminosus]
MLGSKLRSWMEAVRPRKKQQRKEKQLKSNLTNPNGMIVPNSQSVHSARSSENEMLTQDYDNHKNASSRTSVTLHNNLHPSNGVASRLTEVVVNSGLTSPRQRNRIRTNPWVPGNNLSPGNSCVGLHARQDLSKPSVINSPVPTRYLSPTVPRSPINRTSVRRESLSSSSCSSLSAASINWDPSLVRRSPRINSGSDDEEDCTLNEMMGKYDESYVYEKETDILSDSDPTDCETDIDTGQDGGDEDDPLEHEFDFIDNGSYLEFNTDNKDARNTGHCTYYNYEAHRRVSRRRTTRRSQKQDMQNQVAASKQTSERRRRSSSSKRKFKGTVPANKSHPQLINYPQIDGSRSAGATPLSVRRTKHPLSKLVIEEHLRRRSNSVSFSPDTTNAIDQRDKEADKKYKELIVEAEHILMSMKTNGLSPRRLPGPPNKRVELLRNAESAKPDAFIKNRLIEETANLHLSRIPSNNFNSPRFSPKKNHITNFINNNSPVLMRRDVEVRNSPLTPRKELQSCLKTTPNSPLARNKYITPKTDVPAKRSPKYRKKLNKTSNLKQNHAELSSDSDEEPKRSRNLEFGEFCCPQSEPVKRKVYSNQCKTVAFNLNYESVCNTGRLETSASSLSLKKKICFSEVPVNGYANSGNDENKNSSENLRQQVLLNTIIKYKYVVFRRDVQDSKAMAIAVQGLYLKKDLTWKMFLACKPLSLKRQMTS